MRLEHLTRTLLLPPSLSLVSAMCHTAHANKQQNHQGLLLHCRPHQKKKTIEPNCNFFPQLNSSLKIKKNFVLIIKRNAFVMARWASWLGKNRKFQCWDRKKVFAVSCFSFFSRLLCATVRWFTCSVNCEFFFLSLSLFFFYLIALEFGRDSVNRCNMPPPNSHSNWKFN